MKLPLTAEPLNSCVGARLLGQTKMAQPCNPSLHNDLVSLGCALPCTIDKKKGELLPGLCSGPCRPRTAAGQSP